MTSYAFVLSQPFLDRGLGADPGVIHPGQPQHFKSPHPGPPGENILDRVIQHVAEGQNARDIRRRHHDRE